MLHEIRDTLYHGPVDTVDTRAAAIRGRALDIVRQLVSTARAAVRQLLTDRGGQLGDPTWTEAERASLRGWLQVAGAVADQLYFASGVFQVRQSGDDDRHADPAQRARLYHEAHDVVVELVELGEPRAMHQLIEMLEGCIEFDPPGVFVLIARAIRSSATWGYQYESLAEALVVRIVKGYLVDRPAVFRDDELERALMDILDVVVEAGWASARRLVYGLAETFR